VDKPNYQYIQFTTEQPAEADAFKFIFIRYLIERNRADIPKTLPDVFETDEFREFAKKELTHLSWEKLPTTRFYKKHIASRLIKVYSKPCIYYDNITVSDY
jgi:hypothetical protein